MAVVISEIPSSAAPSTAAATSATTSTDTIITISSAATGVATIATAIAAGTHLATAAASTIATPASAAPAPHTAAFDLKDEAEDIALSGIKLSVYQAIEQTLLTTQELYTRKLSELINKILSLHKMIVKEETLYRGKIIELVGRDFFDEMIILINQEAGGSSRTALTFETAIAMLQTRFISASLELFLTAGLSNTLKTNLKKFARKLKEADYTGKENAEIIPIILQLFETEFCSVTRFPDFSEMAEAELEEFFNRMLSLPKFTEFLAIYLTDPWCCKMLSSIQYMQQNLPLFSPYSDTHSRAWQHPSALSPTSAAPDSGNPRADIKVREEARHVDGSVTDRINFFVTVFQKLINSINMMKTVSQIQTITKPTERDKASVVTNELEVDFAFSIYFKMSLTKEFNVDNLDSCLFLIQALASQIISHVESESAIILCKTETNSSVSVPIGRGYTFPESRIGSALASRNPREIYTALMAAQAGGYVIDPETLQRLAPGDYEIRHKVLAIRRPPKVKAVGCFAPEQEKNAALLTQNPFAQATRILAASYAGKEILSLLPVSALESGMQRLFLTEAIVAPILFARGWHALANPKKPMHPVIRMVEAGAETAVVFSYSLGLAIAFYHLDPHQNADISPTPTRTILFNLLLSGPMGLAIFYLIWNSLPPAFKEYVFPEHSKWRYVRKTLDVASKFIYYSGIFQLFLASPLQAAGINIVKDWGKLLFQLGPMVPAVLVTWARFYTTFSERGHAVAMNLCAVGFLPKLLKDLGAFGQLLPSNDPALLGSTYNALRISLWSTLMLGSAPILLKYAGNFRRLYGPNTQLEIFTQTILLPKPKKQKKRRGQEDVHDDQKSLNERLLVARGTLTAAELKSMGESLSPRSDSAGSSPTHTEMSVALTAFNRSRTTDKHSAVESAGASDTAFNRLPPTPGELADAEAEERLRRGNKPKGSRWCNNENCVVS